jgi:5-methylcytosine-specific restriction endonuclease McrA
MRRQDGIIVRRYMEGEMAWTCGCHLGHKSIDEHSAFWDRYAAKRRDRNSKVATKVKKTRQKKHGYSHAKRVAEVALMRELGRVSGGGSQNYAQNYLQHPHWIAKRREALDHYGERCQRCGRKGGFLQVHHKHYRTMFREAMKDLEVLCRGCHKDEHGL